MSDKQRPGIGGAPIYYAKPRRYPSIYARGDVSELPTWIAYDRQVSRALKILLLNNTRHRHVVLSTITLYVISKCQ